MQGDDIQTIQQVFTKAPIAHHVFKIEVGRSQDTYIGAAGDRVTDPLVFLVLDEAQQLGLQRQWEIADFIKEQSAAIGLIDPPQGAFTGPGKRPAAMPEQFAFHQLGGE
ncbi:hypothetical protein D9M71_366840 [compost metagenome]